jgi:sensor histidine kinase regulating citrate/malate metabolism
MGTGLIRFVVFSGFTIFLIVFGMVSLYYFGRRAYLDMVEQKTQYEIDTITQINEMQASIRKQHHDFFEQLGVMLMLISRGKYDELRTYNLELTEKYGKEPLSIMTNNIAFDSLITEKAKQAKKYGIKFDIELTIAKGRKVDQIDSIILMSNMLNNAIEACLLVPDEKERYIKLSITDGTEMDMLMVRMKNSTTGKYRVRLGRMLTIKHEDAHGLGMEQIRAIVDAVGGVLKYNLGPKEFEMIILIPWESDKNA